MTLTWFLRSIMVLGLALGTTQARAQQAGTAQESGQRIRAVTDLGGLPFPTTSGSRGTGGSASLPFFWAGPVFPYGQPYSSGYRFGVTIGRDELGFAYRQGRAIERYRQDVRELQQEIEQRRGYRPTAEATDSYPHRGHGPYPGYGGYGYATVGQFHEFGRELEYYRQQELYLREQLSRLTYDEFLRMGIGYLREGSYGLAARALTAAAEKNHEDAGSRVLACQALVAVGSYQKALAYLRRAVELQPLLVHLPIDLKDEYGSGLGGDYQKHVAKLADYCQAHPDRADTWILLAWERLCSDDPAAAGEALRRARKLAPDDPLVQRLWEAAEPVLDEQE